MFMPAEYAAGPNTAGRAARQIDTGGQAASGGADLVLRCAAHSRTLPPPQEEAMPQPIAYEDAIDLLDADHKMVKKLFIDFNALGDDGAPDEARAQLAKKICAEITVHAQIEEEIFYPAVREAIADDELMDEALEEHQEAKELIASIEKMKPGDKKLDATVKQLAQAIDHHVMEEREQIFLKARYAALDLKQLAVELAKRKKQLHKNVPAPAKEPTP
jgi:hemerythrin superfamily protein